MTDALLNDRRILVVDDEDFSRAAIAGVVQSLGAAEVIEAANGAEAIKALIGPARRADAVVTDLNMMPINGLELLKAVRIGFPGIKRGLPVVMLTALQGFDLVGAALALDVDGFLNKPISRDAVAAALDLALATERPTADPATYQAVTTPGFAEMAEILRELDLPGAEALEAAANLQAPSEDAEAEPAEPETEKEAPLATYSAGGVLSRDVIGGDGTVILGVGTKLSENMLRRLGDLKKIDPEIPDSVWVAVEAEDEAKA